MLSRRVLCEEDDDGDVEAVVGGYGVGPGDTD